MKTIKVIDLLVENSKGNHPDFRFKHTKHMIWKWDGCYYVCGASELDATFRILGQLNNEVEIIEDTPKEDKKITKLDNNIAFYEGIYQTCWNDREVLLVSKINEIIDKVNGEDNE